MSIDNLLATAETDRARKTFYPTPEALADKLLSGVNWNKVGSILEPSAGTGNLARYCAGKLFYVTHRYPAHDEHSWKEAIGKADVDCIEIDPAFRERLEGDGYRVVHDDFLSFETQKRYDLCVMNPPFDEGAAHLLKAMDVMRRGGTICCILNAETLRNPYSWKREQLMDALQRYDAQIEYVEHAFAGAERRTDVAVALIRFEIPHAAVDSTIMEDMRRAPTYRTAAVPPEISGGLTQYNAIEEWVNRYNYEVACGIRLIEEYMAMLDMLNAGLDKYDKPMLSLRVADKDNYGPLDDSFINRYIAETRGKYWRQIFTQPVITEKFTRNLLEELRDMVGKLVNYEFSVYNILTLIIRFNGKTIKGVEDTIIDLFDSWTASYWHEDSPNRHYYNGWKTNDCFRIGKKVIVSLSAFDYIWGRFDHHRINEYLSDVEKTLDFLDGGHTEWPHKLYTVLEEATREGRTKNVETKFFYATFYKKGTCHLVFKDLDLMEKFNMFASQKKGWLPPTYGKKRYRDMTAEEQKVVDSFQGKDRYEEVMARADYFLNAGPGQLLLGAPGA